MHISELKIGEIYTGDCGSTSVILRKIDLESKLVMVEYSSRDIRTWGLGCFEHFLCNKFEYGDMDSGKLTLGDSVAEVKPTSIFNNVIKYITFDTSLEFEEWQWKNNNTNKIISISPILMNIGANVSSDEISMNPAMGIFVTYKG